jgi:hypothetical protein
MVHVSGRLCRFDGKTWRVVYDSSKVYPDWWGLPTSIDAVGFDRTYSPVLLSSTLGLVRREENGWKRLTPTWPKFAYVRCLHVALTGQAVIGLLDGGVLLIDLKTGQARRVVLDHSGQGPAS